MQVLNLSTNQAYDTAVEGATSTVSSLYEYISFGL